MGDSIGEGEAPADAGKRQVGTGFVARQEPRPPDAGNGFETVGELT